MKHRAYLLTSAAWRAEGASDLSIYSYRLPGLHQNTTGVVPLEEYRYSSEDLRGILPVSYRRREHIQAVPQL